MNRKKALHIFNISNKWIDYNVISIDNLIQKAVEYQKTKIEHNLEHYPISFLYKYLENKKEVTDTEMNNFIELAETEIEEGMTESLLIALLKHDFLTANQFENIRTYLVCKKKYKCDKTINRQTLLRKLKCSQNLETLRECVNSGDSVVHLKLLDIENIPIEILAELEVKGSNKKVRHLAVQKRKKY